jgi:hypothetical protein
MSTSHQQYLAWIKQNQQNNPEWKAANVWQNRNQSEIKPTQKKPSDKLPEGTEIVDETPEE